MSFNLNEYVDVAERIRQFYERYPDGRLTTGSPPQVIEVGGKPFVWYHARAYRTPDDQFPADGWAAEPIPGPTQFTRDSELMNAETAAWGRAIVALGFPTKHIASAEDVRNRSGDAKASTGTQPKGKAAASRENQTKATAAAADPTPKQISEWTGLKDRILELYSELGVSVEETERELVRFREHEHDLDWLRNRAKNVEDRAKAKRAEKSPFQTPAKAKVA